MIMSSSWGRHHRIFIDADVKKEISKSTTMRPVSSTTTFVPSTESPAQDLNIFVR